MIMEQKRPEVRAREEGKVRLWLVQAIYVPKTRRLTSALVIGNEGEGQVREPSSNVQPGSA